MLYFCGAADGEGVFDGGARGFHHAAMWSGRLLDCGAVRRWRCDEDTPGVLEHRLRWGRRDWRGDGAVDVVSEGRRARRFDQDDLRMVGGLWRKPWMGCGRGRLRLLGWVAGLERLRCLGEAEARRLRRGGVWLGSCNGQGNACSVWMRRVLRLLDPPLHTTAKDGAPDLL